MKFLDKTILLAVLLSSESEINALKVISRSKNHLNLGVRLYDSVVDPEDEPDKSEIESYRYEMKAME